MLNNGRRNYSTKSSSENINKTNVYSENIFSYLDIIKNYISEYKEYINENKNISLDESNKLLRNIQNKIEQNWIDDVRNKLLYSDQGKNLLNNQIFKVYESWKIFVNSKHGINKITKIFQDELIIEGLKSIDNLIIGFTIVLTYHNIWSYTNIANRIGKECLYNIYKNHFNLEEGINMNFQEFLKKYNINKDAKVKLGSWIIETFIDKNIFTDVIPSSMNQNSTTVLTINKETLENVINKLIIHPSSLPMISPPLNWSSKEFGGFLFNKTEKIDIIRGSESKHIHDESKHIHDDSKSDYSESKHGHSVLNKENLYIASNYLNNIKFKINNKLLDYIQNEGSFLLFEKRPTFKSELAAFHSKELQRVITLKIAEVYKDLDFYLNVHADWRTRIYTASFWIDYQGSDLSKSLLEFSYGEPLNEIGRDYLYIYGANLYDENNISKISYRERILWVINNKQDILDMKENFMKLAKEKFRFAAFCLIMRELESDPKSLVHLPIFLDATCSGIQHLAGLFHDHELGSRVNLINQSDESKVEDIYSTLVNPINKAINNYGKNKWTGIV